MAARPGFEPGQTEPESVVLPLHHRADKGDNVIRKPQNTRINP